MQYANEDIECIGNEDSQYGAVLKSTIQAMYVQRNNEASSRNHCYCGEVISITYWPVCGALVRACVRVGVRERGCVHAHAYV
jgi:hypothetical protein